MREKSGFCGTTIEGCATLSYIGISPSILEEDMFNMGQL